MTCVLSIEAVFVNEGFLQTDAKSPLCRTTFFSSNAIGIHIHYFSLRASWTRTSCMSLKGILAPRYKVRLLTPLDFILVTWPRLTYCAHFQPVPPRPKLSLWNLAPREFDPESHTCPCSVSVWSLTRQVLVLKDSAYVHIRIHLRAATEAETSPLSCLLDELSEVLRNGTHSYLKGACRHGLCRSRCFG